MKVLYGLLVLSVSAILVTGVAMWWRLHRHLRRPNAAQNEALKTVQTEHESSE
jgi:cytochrome b subunit of formate dehydrogenase